MAKRLSIAVCTYNRHASLDATLSSIVKAKRPTDIAVEIIVVNNNSTDRTREIVKRHARNDNRVKSLFESNQGVSHARNAAIASAEGEYIAFTDDDVVVDNNWLVDYVRVIEEEEPTCVGGKVLPLWEDGKPEWLGRELYPMLALLDFHAERVSLDIPKLWSANLCVSTKAARQYGGFNTNKGPLKDQLFRGEDTEFVLRLINAGERVLYDPTPTVWHRIGSDRTRKSYFRKWRFDSARNYARHDLTTEPLSRQWTRGLYRLMILMFDKKNWTGTEKDRLLNQLEIMAAAGRIIGLIDRGLARNANLSS